MKNTFDQKVKHQEVVTYGRRIFIQRSSLAAAAAALVPLYTKCTGDGTVSFAILSDLHYVHHQRDHFSLDKIKVYRSIINKLNPDFVVLNGDNINDDGPILVKGSRSYERFTEAFHGFYSDFLSGFNESIKVYPVMGNHDPCFPGQRNMNIMHELMNDEKFLFLHRELVRKCTGDLHNMEYYSWDEGDWHFLTVPCGGTKYLEALGLFNWLENDLKTSKDKNTIIYMHAPALSIGMTDSYFIDVKQKGIYMDLFTKYGNVKYVFSGHIHNSTKVSVRSARNFNGTNFIVCPTHVLDQRPFGKDQKYPEEYNQNNHGFIFGYLGNDGEELFSILPDETRIEYPDQFAAYYYHSNPINFHQLASLPPAKDEDDVFGDQRLKGWYANYVYNEETDPSFIREVSAGVSRSGKIPVHMALKGRTNVYEDFQNIGQANSVYKYFETPGNTKKCRIGFSYMVEKMQFAETDLRKHPNPSGTELRPGRFRYPFFYNLGIITIGFVKNNSPVFEYEINLGKWLAGPGSARAQSFDVMKYRCSIFDYGEWIHPENKKSVEINKIETGEWKDVMLDFAKESAEGIDFDRILVAYTLTNDGLSGHEMSVFFDDLDITAVQG